MGRLAVGRKINVVWGHLAFSTSLHIAVVCICVCVHTLLYVLCVPSCVLGSARVLHDLLKGLAVIPEFLCVKCLLWGPFTACVLYGPWSHSICLSLLHFWGLFLWLLVFIIVCSIRKTGGKENRPLTSGRCRFKKKTKKKTMQSLFLVCSETFCFVFFLLRAMYLLVCLL